MAQIKYIKDLYENEEASLREICRITGHSFETVRKYAYQENWSEDNLPDIEPQSYPVLQDFIPIIDKWLEEDRKAPRKQRHTVMRIYHRLCDEHGFTGCYSTVKKYVRKKKYVMKTLSAGYLPLEHPKGWGQVDFGLAEGEWAATGERFPFYALTISFPGSNNGVTQAFPSQNQECLLEGMKRIFEHIGGVPPRLRFDNMTTAVAQVLKDGERVLTDGFTRFMLHYRFQADFCNPASGNEKGRAPPIGVEALPLLMLYPPGLRCSAMAAFRRLTAVCFSLPQGASESLSASPASAPSSPPRRTAPALLHSCESARLHARTDGPAASRCDSSATEPTDCLYNPAGSAFRHSSIRARLPA